MITPTQPTLRFGYTYMMPLGPFRPYFEDDFEAVKPDQEDAFFRRLNGFSGQVDGGDRRQQHDLVALDSDDLDDFIALDPDHDMLEDKYHPHRPSTDGYLYRFTNDGSSPEDHSLERIMSPLDPSDSKSPSIQDFYNQGNWRPLKVFLESEIQAGRVHYMG